MSKNKGSAFERAICKKLSLWVTDLLRTDVFWRSAMSGGRTHKRTRPEEFEAQAGDITSTREEGNLLISLFVIECKCCKDLSLHHLFYDRRGTLGEFWEQVSTEAASYNKRPMLIAKQNRYPEIIVVDAAGFEILERGAACNFAERVRVTARGLYVFLLRDVLKDVDFKKLRASYKRKTLRKG